MQFATVYVTDWHLARLFAIKKTYCIHYYQKTAKRHGNRRNWYIVFS